MMPGQGFEFLRRLKQRRTIAIGDSPRPKPPSRPRGRAGWALPRNLLIIAIAVGAALVARPLGNLEAQSLDEVLRSPEMKTLKKTRPSKEERRRTERIQKNSNFSLIWDKQSAPELLLGWLGATTLEYRPYRLGASVSREYAEAHVEFEPQPKVRIRLDVQIPHPLYASLVDLGAFEVFNRFIPPYLAVQVDQVLPFEGIEAHYYRTTMSECSLHFKVAKNGIVNLSTPKCSDAPVMLKIARSLSFVRLNQKLSS